METTTKKILFVITKSNFGGAQRYVYELAERLPRDRFSVLVACGGTGVLTQKLSAAGIRVRTISSFERDIHIGKEIRASTELWCILKDEHPDIVHLNSSKAAGIGALLARLCGVPRIIFTAHGWPFFEQRNIFARILIWLLSYITVLLSHQTIVVSGHDMRHAYMPFVRSKIVHIHTALSPITFLDRTDARTQLFSEASQIHHAADAWAVSTGELTHNKNIEALLTAIATHNAQESKKIFLTIIGDGEERAKLTSLVETYQLSAQVHFAGYVDNARAYLRAFDIFCMPSRKEGLPYGLLEAGAAELGCVASNVGGIPEVIDDGVNGFLVDPKEPITITEALTRYTRDSVLSKTHGVALAKKVQHNFDLETMVRATVECYDSKNSRAT